MYLCSVLKMAKTCLLDMKPFSTSLSFKLSRGSMYFFSFSWQNTQTGPIKTLIGPLDRGQLSKVATVKLPLHSNKSVFILKILLSVL